MSKGRKTSRFNTGDIISYRRGMKWRKTGYNQWTCIAVGKDSLYTVGEIKLVSGDYDTWIANDYTLISFNNYLNEIENSIANEGTN